MAKIKELQFKDVEWDLVDDQKIGYSWESGIGFYALIWRNKNGTANNKLLYRVRMPDSLHALIKQCTQDCIDGD